MWPIRPLLIPALLLLTAPVASANNVYISQSGGGTGSSCASPLAVGFFNTAANWTAGTPIGAQIGPGTTVHLCGTFTGAVGANMLTFQGSGTSGNPITLLFESGAALNSPAWSQSLGAIKDSGSWTVIDGGTNGIVQNTANGSGLANHQPSTGVALGGSNNIVQNLTVANICVHIINDANGCIVSGAGDQAISVFGSNITITKNTIHDTQTGINTCCGAFSNVTVSFNTISRVNWGIGIGTFNASASGLVINGNDIFCVLGAACNWDSSDNVNFHHNGVMIDPQGIGGIDVVTISNNRIRDFGTFQTAHSFIDPNTASVTHLQIYNNVFAVTSGATGPGVAFVTLQEAPTGTHPGPVTAPLVANNTISGGGGGCIVGQVSPTWENNICSGPFNPLKLYTGFTSPTSDFNDFFNFGGSFVAGSTNFSTLAAWQSGTGLDTHSVTTNPNLTATYTLTTSLPGTNLTSLGIAGLDIGAPQFFGVNFACGNGCLARPSSGNWDMGAYPFAPTTPPSAPTGLAASISGSTISLSWTASAGTPTPTAYTLYRSTAHNGPYTAVSSGITSTSTTDTPANGTYFYVVTAFVGGAISSITGNGTTGTITCTGACLFPSGTVFTVAGNSVAGFNSTFITSTGQPTSSTVTFNTSVNATGTGGGIWQPANESGKSNEVTATVPAALTMTLAPASFAFASTTVGSSSATQAFTLTNTSTAGNTVTISSISFTGTNPGDFSQTNNCPSLLMSGLSCAINGKFSPTASGARSATLTVVDNAVGSPHTAAVSGTGVAQAPGVSFNPTSLIFGPQTVSTTSTVLSIILTNTGSGTLTVTSVVASGDFAVTTVPATNCGTTLASLATCSLNVTFTPTATGGRTGAVTVTDNAAGSPHVATLAGTGITTKCAFANTVTLSGMASVCQ